jgi:Bacteriophage lambda head decoration protein D
MTVLTEGRYGGEAILSEAPGALSRSNVRVGASQTILANGLLARVANTAGVSIAQSFAGTGNGVLTLASPAYNSKVKDGAYKLTCVTVAANGGVFRVEDPMGNSLGNATVGAAFAKEIRFTIADGATDFALGDEFTLAVSFDEEDAQYVAYNPSGSDGSEVPAALSIYAVTTGVGVSQLASAMVRSCELNGSNIAWPSGITTAQKNDAIQALEARGVIVR